MANTAYAYNLICFLFIKREVSYLYQFYHFSLFVLLLTFLCFFQGCSYSEGNMKNLKVHDHKNQILGHDGVVPIID